MLLWEGLRKELSGGYARTTNNRMELMAVICALEALKFPCEVTLYSDSTYVVHAVEKGWLMQWEQERFKKRKNPDLWMRFLTIYRRHKVSFIWVKGHANNPENERCDRLAVAAASQPNLPLLVIFCCVFPGIFCGQHGFFLHACPCVEHRDSWKR